MKKFEISKTSERQKINQWFTHCSKEQIPYVVIKKKTKYASIEWDYINFNSKFDKVFVANAEKNQQMFTEIFKKYGNSKSEYTISNLTFFVKNIAIENSQAFAEEIFEVVISNLNWNSICSNNLTNM